MPKSLPTVLVVEDMPRVRETAVDMFERLGASVLDAYNGEDALRMLLMHPEVDLLFVDVRMPGMSGIELADKARAVRPHLRIVLTSAFTDERPLPDMEFVKKPWELDDLQRLLDPNQQATGAPRSRSE